MSREVLPSRRESETLTFNYALDVGFTPHKFTATVSRYHDGRIAELFLNCTKVGTAVDNSARDAAVAVSIALQHGVPVDVMRNAMGRHPNGSAASPIGALLDILASA